MSIEGLYRWIIFAPSKIKSTRPVAARFFGVFSDGAMKVRGLACRRRDTPHFIRDFQEEALAELAKARNLEELKQRRAEAAKIYDRYRMHLESGKVEPGRLVIEQVLSREIEDYSVETRASLAAREMIADGVNVHPGEMIGYVITDAKAKNKGERITTGGGKGEIVYDREEYLSKLEKAAAEIFNYQHDGLKEC